MELMLEEMTILQRPPTRPAPQRSHFFGTTVSMASGTWAKGTASQGQTSRKRPHMFHPSFWPQLAAGPPAWPRVRPSELTHGGRSQRPTLSEVTRCAYGSGGRVWRKERSENPPGCPSLSRKGAEPRRRQRPFPLQPFLQVRKPPGSRPEAGGSLGLHFACELWH